jgi:methylenetetrahydrofolate reductase (NADPH)
VGPSIKILEDNYSNVGKLLTSYSPSKFLDDLSSKTLANPNNNIQKVHFYPFGGIKELLNTYN